MKVLFNQPKEFCEELEKDAPQIDRGIVRTTLRYQVSKMSPNVHHVFALATYSISGQVVEMEKYCGDLWSLDQQQDDKVRTKAADSLKAVEETAKRCNCEIRSGRLEE